MDVLHTLAEISIAYTGFSGVVGVFGRGSQIQGGERSFRVRLLVQSSLTALFAALAPLALAEFAVSESIVWGLPSVGLGCHLVFSSSKVRSRSVGLGANYSQPRFAPLWYVLSAAMALLLLLGAAQLLPARPLYIVGVIFHLSLASWHFLLLVTQSSGEPAA